MGRAADLAFVLVAAAPGAAAMAIIASAIRLTMGRPILFRQVRAGRSGIPFSIVKFRTMTDARGPGGALLPDADRTPPLGRFLRRSRFDELPELWNVLRGDMALIGPRPLLPATLAGWGIRGALRGRVRPGLTGWSQVNGNTLLAPDDKLALDLWYVGHASALLDFRILARTLRVVLRGEHIDHDAVRTACASNCGGSGGEHADRPAHAGRRPRLAGGRPGDPAA